MTVRPFLVLVCIMMFPSIQRVMILGAGWVGRQIAACLAQAEVDVWLVDRDRQVCDDALRWIHGLPNAAAWSARVGIADSTAALVGQLESRGTNLELAIESVPEQISLKKRVLRQLSSQLPAPTILASNSSYFTPSQLAEFVDIPERFAHVHFHVPVLVRSVVDIVGSPCTAPEVLDRLQELVARSGHQPLRLRREHPGYIFNWLLQSVLRSALELSALGVADADEIDLSWKSVTGMPVGPFGIMDRIGLDVIEQVLSNARWATPPEVDVDQLLAILRTHTAAGELGVKSGRGFYSYDNAATDQNSGDSSGLL